MTAGGGLLDEANRPNQPMRELLGLNAFASHDAGADVVFAPGLSNPSRAIDYFALKRDLPTSPKVSDP